MRAFKLSKELEETKEAKQQNYIFREQEYRTVIQGLREEIERVSQKPLARVKARTEDELQMEAIKLRLDENETGLKLGRATWDTDENNK